MEKISGPAPYPIGLRRITSRLDQLRAIVDELRGGQTRALEAEVELAAHVDVLAEDLARQADATAAAGERERERDARIAELAAAVAGFQGEATAITRALADIASQPDPAAQLAALEDRIQDAEDQIAALLLRLDGANGTAGPGANELIETLGRRSEETAGMLRAQGERLRLLETRSAQQDRDLTGLRDDAHAALGHRIDALEKDVIDTRERGRGEQLAVDHRLDGLRRRSVTGSIVAILMAGGLAGALWWWGNGTLERTEVRLAALEGWTSAGPVRDLQRSVTGMAGEAARLDARLTEILARQPATEAGAPEMELLRGRLAALEQSQVEAARAAARAGEVAAAATARLQALEAERASLSARIEEAFAAVAAGERRLTEMAGRVAAPVAGEAGEGAVGGEQAPVRDAMSGETGAPADLRTEGAGRAAESESGVAAAPSPSETSPAVPSQAPASASGSGGTDDVSSVGPGPVTAAAPGEAAAEPRVLEHERYVIQLIGFRSPDSVTAFAREQGIASEARTLRERVRGRPWYAVILGDYGSQAEAQAAARTLPDGLQALGPWVRAIPAGSELMPLP